MTKNPTILLWSLFEHSGDICWDLCDNETIEFFESNLIWILWWHVISSFCENVFESLWWQSFSISSLPKTILLFIDNVFRFQKFHCICIISGDKTLPYLHCQKHWYLWWQCILVSWMPMYLNLFIDNVFVALWCKRWFSSWDSSFRSLHWQSMCYILECVHSSLCYCDVHEVMTTFLCLFWRLCEKRIWRKEKKLFWLFSVQSLWIFSLFFFEKILEKKSKSEKEKN